MDQSITIRSRAQSHFLAHEDAQPGARQYTSEQTLEDPEIVQLCPRSSNAKKAFQDRQVHSASRSVVVISDRDRAFSASQKASLDKSPRMRPKISPMFTISPGAIPAPRDCGRLDPVLAELERRHGNRGLA